MQNKKGFTLVELLVVIAIIGILSSVAIVNLNSARDKAKVAAVKGNLASIIPAVILCHDAGEDIKNGAGANCNGTTIWTEGGTLCGAAGASANWPDLGSNGSPDGTCNSSYSAGTFSFSATASDSNSTVITCNESGCS